MLDGVFSDESGDYPTGTYVRNPVGSSHTPATAPGCTIFVKLCQFQPGDNVQVVVRPEDRNWQALTPGIEVAGLHEFGAEAVRLVRWQASVELNLTGVKGCEALLLEGSIKVGQEAYQNVWLRFPVGRDVRIAGTAGTMIMLKTGHLPGE